MPVYIAVIALVLTGCSSIQQAQDTSDRPGDLEQVFYVKSGQCRMPETSSTSFLNQVTKDQKTLRFWL